MNNLTMSLKKFFKNKNTITIIGIMAIILLLYLGYRYQINSAVSPVSVPVAATTINPKEEITSDMITYVEVSPIVINKNVIRDRSQIVGKYANVNTVIPEGSMFYNNVTVDKSELPGTNIEVDEGQVPYNFGVNMETTYGNAITPDSYIDIYMKAVNDDEQLMVGKLIANIKVLSVIDSSGKDVFGSVDETRTPAYLIFGVVDEINILLRKASYLSSVELFPVPHGYEFKGEDATSVSSQTLKDYINSHSVPNDEIVENTNDNNAANEG